MKKFLTKICAYALIVGAITLAVNACFLWITRNDFYVDVPDGIDICNFGSSHGLCGFNYKDFEESYVCMNFALNSQSLLYDYRLLQHYKPKLKRGAVVFITMSYFSLFGAPEAEGDTFLSKNKRYYKLLPRELILAYDWKTDMYENYLPVLNPAALKVLLKRLLHLDDGAKIAHDNFNALKTTSSDDTLNVSKTYSTPEELSNDVALDAPKAYGRHISHQKDSNGIRMRRQESFEALYGMIELCRELGARPILVTVPYTRAYTETIRKNDPEFFPDFYAELKNIQAKTGVEYYDYGFDERFRNDYYLFNYYNNSDHLNREGSRRFTDILFCEVLGITPEKIPPAN